MPRFVELSRELSALVEESSVALAAMAAREDVSMKPSPTRWSKKEILGHLVDSASNNHQRFVRAALEGSLSFVDYEQEGWARIQRHNDASWDELLQLWMLFSRHLAFVIRHLPAESAAALVRIADSEPVSLDWLVDDYIKHMRHHLQQLMSDRSRPVPPSDSAAKRSSATTQT